MNEVVIYGTATCSYCLRAKELLDSKDVAYTEYRVDEEPHLREQMIEKSGGGKTVPQIFIGDEAIGGCDDLFALEQAGELDVLLTQKGESNG